MGSYVSVLCMDFNKQLLYNSPVCHQIWKVDDYNNKQIVHYRAKLVNSTLILLEV